MITTLYASLLGILYLALTAYVIKGRFKYRIGLGDGGNPDMIQRIRMHGNFVETVPFALLLLFLVEISNFSYALIHILGVALFVGRVLHALGLHRTPYSSIGRTGGMVLTLTMVLLASGLLLYRFFVIASLE